ncbi:type I phosphomannose isomerase catalytic subunit [Deinococcus humi]|uniref:Phosphohexomutase n=1 Tax=Deinococcus humi TaxID=662880 RepID=A0A7W8NF07_9DEIO|nr:type I phosphomannose isomerase catalytic subunit [Deinococcus humi]MBB5361517.1 mannose-6-phosphate isomerase [Deinococcus humi]GGO20452.1 mannose-6-phosphate isomerase [Deinococcus humi]
MTHKLSSPLPLESRLVERVWGGTRLIPDGSNDRKIGEAWVVGEDNHVSGGPHAGQTLAELSAQFPKELLGHRATSGRFPLLIKLLDCAEWLSVQVHPDDAQARELEGEGFLGKTEAWHLLAADDGAQIIAGIRDNTSQDTLSEAILAGKAMDHVAYTPVHAGDTFMIPAGTVHALGPGVFLYEVQQTSDLTYRIYDWDRPATAGRALHLSQSAAVARPWPAPTSPLPPAGEAVQELTRCDYFVLERLTNRASTLTGDTAGQTFHVLTVTEGEARVEVNGEQHTLGQFESLLLPAAVGAYRLSGSFEMLRSSLPE